MAFWSFLVYLGRVEALRDGRERLCAGAPRVGPAGTHSRSTHRRLQDAQEPKILTQVNEILTNAMFIFLFPASLSDVLSVSGTA